MKILLINPPFFRFIGLEQDYVPLSLLSVGSWYERLGNEVKILNLELGRGLSYLGYFDRTVGYDRYLDSAQNDDHEVWRFLQNKIDEFDPDKIGITVLSVKKRSADKIINIASRRGIPCIVGGMHPTLDAGDYAMNSIEVWKGVIEDCPIDETPVPNFDLLMDEYSPNGYAHLVTARGCPYRCSFCASSSMENGLHYKSIDRVLLEMRIISDRFHPNTFTIWDETFTFSKARIAEFCCRYDLPAKWRCDTRADSLSEDLVVMMKNSGCTQMSIGIESGNEEILKRINKKETLYDYRYAAEVLNKYGVQWKAYCIIGFPFETEENMRETIRFVKSLCPSRITISYFTPYPGTELYKYCLEHGIVKPGFDLTLFSHQSPHNYFTHLIPWNRYVEVRDDISKEADVYNGDGVKLWK